ncbi:MAG: dihydropteroate synthase [Methylococcaceae bacterium]|nr:dihydropteroate synthase [Methylococcaceae bacterium]
MLDLAFLSELADRHAGSLRTPVTAFELRGQSFEPWPEASMMGVVNLSRDSWYRESVVMNVEAAVRRGRRLAVEGARIIDVGAESTILNALRVDAETQVSQLLPVVSELGADGILVSVESYHPEVSRACLQAGAAVINLTAGERTEPFYRLAAEHGAGVIICYVQNGENVREVGDFQWVEDHSSVLYDYFAREIELAVHCGVKCLWIDPGLGFYYKNLNDSGARVRYQIETFLNSFRLRTLGWPVCHALPHAFEYFEEEVRCAEPFFGLLALLGQTDLLRTHEVARLRGVIESMQTNR